MIWSDLRVLEIGSAAPAAYCGRLFADLGARVTKIEPPGGDPFRSASPKTAAGASGWFAALNLGKKSRVLDRDDPGAVAELAGLAAECDLLLDGRPMDEADCPALVEDAVPARAVRVRMTWFGDDGPYAGFQATDSVCRALAGLTRLVGPAEGPPIGAPDFQAGILGGLWAFIAASAALIGRDARGRGARLTLSVHEACLSVGEYLMAESWSRGDVFRRIGENRFWPTYPVGIYRAADGWIGVTTITPAQWRSLCDALGLDRLRDDPDLTTSLERLPHLETIDEQIAPRLRERSVADWFAEGLARRIPIVPVPSLDDLIASADLRANGAVVPITVAGHPGATLGSMLRVAGTVSPSGGTVPELGQDSTRPEKPALAAVQTRRAPDAPRGDDAIGELLAGVRVVDFTMGWAGPLCTRVFADFGADVVKVESCRYPDWWRGVDRRPPVFLERLYEKSPRFAWMNRNKRAVTLDLTRQDGVALARRLVRDADLVVDNYSAGIMDKLGLGQAALRAEQPSLVVMSMTAFGSTGPNRECRAYGSTLEQGSGLPQLVGEPGGPPCMGHPAYGDPVGGLHGAAAALAAVRHARRTGEGQFIDLSQVEAMMPFTAPWMVARSAGGEAPRYGRRHPDHVPHGTFRCAGEDAWIQVAVPDDAAWLRLCRAIERSDLAADPSLRTAAGRRAREDEIEDALSTWCGTRIPDEAMGALQADGVPAGVLRSPYEMLTDPHLAVRGFLQELDRPFLGRHPQASIPVRQDGDGPVPIRSVAPTLGRDNREIFRDLLGLSNREIDALEADGLIGTELLPELPKTSPRLAAKAALAGTPARAAG